MVAAVPHSGNECSGLCNTPCSHSDCWQCVEVWADRTSAGKPRVLVSVADHRVAQALFASEVWRLLQTETTSGWQTQTQEMQSAVADVLVGRADKMNTRIKEMLKAKGASDDDIAAAERVLQAKHAKETKLRFSIETIGWKAQFGGVGHPSFIPESALSGLKDLLVVSDGN